jgi:hypothetical protein
MPISFISQQWDKSQNQFPAGNAGELSATDVNGLSTNSSLQQASCACIKPLKPFFCNLQREFTLDFEIKYQQFHAGLFL